MIGLLLEAFSELVNENNWMDDATKRLAIIKAKSMISNIGYPDITKDSSRLDDQYKLVRHFVQLFRVIFI